MLGTFNDLVHRIAMEVEDILKDSYVHSNDSKNEVIKINVFEGFMPIRNSRNKQDEKSDYPAVIVRFMKAKNDVDKTNRIAHIRLIVATYNEDGENGWKENLNIAQRLESELLRRTCIGPFSIENSSEVDFPEEQVLPFWTSVIEMQFTMQSTVTEIDWRRF